MIIINKEAKNLTESLGISDELGKRIAEFAKNEGFRFINHIQKARDLKKELSEEEKDFHAQEAAKESYYIIKVPNLIERIQQTLVDDGVEITPGLCAYIGIVAMGTKKAAIESLEAARNPVEGLMRMFNSR